MDHPPTWASESPREWAGSVDTTSVVCPACAKRTASEAARLVLPTPPLPDTITYLRSLPAANSSNALLVVVAAAEAPLLLVGAGSLAAAAAAEAARLRRGWMAGIAGCHRRHANLPSYALCTVRGTRGGAVLWWSSRLHPQQEAAIPVQLNTTLLKWSKFEIDGEGAALYCRHRLLPLPRRHLVGCHMRTACCGVRAPRHCGAGKWWNKLDLAMEQA